MRATPLVIAVLGLAVVTGCASEDNKPDAAAPPAANQSASESATPAPTGGTAKPPAAGAGDIRSTDWNNVALSKLLTYGDVTFKSGVWSVCRILPGGAKPAYGHFINEEPAGRPSTEDALVLVTCGDSDTEGQNLIPVQLDGTNRRAVSNIAPDQTTGPGTRMTFVDYRIENGTIVTTVKKPDGKTEVRKYGWGGNGWAKI